MVITNDVYQRAGQLARFGKPGTQLAVIDAHQRPFDGDRFFVFAKGEAIGYFKDVRCAGGDQQPPNIVHHCAGKLFSFNT